MANHSSPLTLNKMVNMSARLMVDLLLSLRYVGQGACPNIGMDREIVPPFL